MIKGKKFPLALPNITMFVAKGQGSPPGVRLPYHKKVSRNRIALSVKVFSWIWLYLL